MSPAPGEHLLRFAGDRVTFRIDLEGGAPAGWSGFLRTNLGRAQALRDEVVASLAGGPTFAGQSWRDIPLRRCADGWVLDLPLVETGWFRAKPYLVDPQGRQHWPPGSDVGISVHPDGLRTRNTVYCAFVRMFGASRAAVGTRHAFVDEQLSLLDRNGYTVIPPSGKLRDLAEQLPHIVDALGCTVLHLLPVGPTPTTFARFGRFGSPYACLDLTGIDPALVVFDRRSTAVDQFRELTYAAHLKGCRVLLDVVVNHTGWGSTLQETRPDWFKRDGDGAFHSPGAWGNTWEDLVELEHRDVALWDRIAEALIIWCQRGVDGFRCDAGYMVPLPAWQYIIARVRCEFPDAIFLLEGLGGSWDATDALLTEGGMQWAYSELFQNYTGEEVQRYLDACQGRFARHGVMVHYSETHDNDRLARKGRAWSRFRNQLCALTSQCGAFGFSAGVEWLATEKLEVHQSRGLNWGAADNLIPELARLNALLAHHPAFFDGARLERLSPPGSPVYCLLREPAEPGGRGVLVLANTDPEQARQVPIAAGPWAALGEPGVDLLAQPAPAIARLADGSVLITVAPATCHCLAAARDLGHDGGAYRRARAQAAWAYRCLAERVQPEQIGPCSWRTLAAWSSADPVRFLAAVNRLDAVAAQDDPIAALDAAAARADLPEVVLWGLHDIHRVVPVPPGHWLLLRDASPFSAGLRQGAGKVRQVRSIEVDGGHIACFPPAREVGQAELVLERYASEGRQASGRLLLLDREPVATPSCSIAGTILLTNGRGGMARLAVDFGTVYSKYDCALGANLHPEAPCDRHVLVKRVRAWLIADGFSVPLDRTCLAGCAAGPPARWDFVAKAGDGRTVGVALVADMLEGRNTTVLRFSRPPGPPAWGRDLDERREVRLVLRVDVEDRSFHSETRRCAGAEEHFRRHIAVLDGRPGFAFRPADDRQLRCWASIGSYTPEEEWCERIPHQVEAGRGQAGEGDAWSPGWFELPLRRGTEVELVLCADPEDPPGKQLAALVAARDGILAGNLTRSGLAQDDDFGRALAAASGAYVVRRGAGRTVIAGYPWFLDWGRDTFISARGLLAAGRLDEVRDLLTTFGRFEEGGTLPNLLNGDQATNRDTSDAPLWYALACEEASALAGPGLLRQRVGDRTLLDVLRSIAAGYLAGTANGIRVDPESGLVWSPPHFTWMDTNYPACSPREGYPIEIQALWIRLLRQLEQAGAEPPGASGPLWSLADRATRSLHQRFWRGDRGWFADCLHAPGGLPASQARADDHLRPNQLLAIALGIVTGDQARLAVAACTRWLLVPGAIRSLAPLPVDPPLPLHAVDGSLLNDPLRPYWGCYAGDEDTQRKPAYHNGTAWTWPFPAYCEALAEAWNRSPSALAAARAQLGAMAGLMGAGCLGHLPELLDGDAPHAQKGCDAQAWAVTEALRVWRKLAYRPDGAFIPASRASGA